MDKCLQKWSERLVSEERRQIEKYVANGIIKKEIYCLGTLKRQQITPSETLKTFK
jgi:hypothetical protein